MKKKIAFLLSLVMVLALFTGLSINAFAEESITPRIIDTSFYDGINYHIDARNGTIYVISDDTYLGDGHENAEYDVYCVQHSLDALDRTSQVYGDTLHCNPGTIDGLWGPNTKEAVKAFQGYSGAGRPALSVDGIVGPNTWLRFIDMLNHYD